MKKIFIMMACVATMLVGCSKDDDTNKDNNASDTPTVQLKDNQASLDGKVYDVESSVGWQINADDENRYFVDAVNEEFTIRFDLYQSIRDKVVNLADPMSAGTDISLMINREGFYFDQEIHPRDNYVGYTVTIGEEETQGEGSAFRTGTLKVHHTDDSDFSAELTGTLINGRTIDLKVNVPKDSIDIWSSGK